jgi:hypothetical protein
MVFHDKYELLALRSGEGEIALPGREILSGQPVVVHLMTSGHTPAVEEMLRRLKDLSAEDQRHVLDKGDHDGIPFVVTAVLPGKLSLSAWLETLAPPPVVKPPLAETEPVEDPSASTRLFVKRPVAPVPETPVPVSSAPAAKAAVPEPPAEEGEFTRMMRTPPPVAPVAKPVVETASTPKPPAPEAPPEPGEFTRLLKTPPPAAPAAKPVVETATTPKPAAPEPPPEPGEFTRLLKTPPPAAPAAKPVVETASTPKLPTPEAPPEPGEFTRLMKTPPPVAPAAKPVVETASTPQPPAPEAPPAPKPEASPEPGEFTRLFKTQPPISSSTVNKIKITVDRPASESAPTQTLQSPLPDVKPSEATPQAPSAAAEAAPGQGEFTRMFKTPPPVAPATVQVTEIAKPAGSSPAPESSEFSRMFKTSAPIAPRTAAPPVQESKSSFQAPAAPAAQPGTSGEFTKMMQSPLAETPRRSNPFNNPAPSSKSTQPPSEFTRIMKAEAYPGAPTAGKMPPLPPAPRPASGRESFASGGEFTRMFATEPVSADNMPATTPLPQGGPNTGTFSKPASPAPSSGPGEFTSMFAAPSPAKPMAPKPPSAAPAATPLPVPKKSNMTLILILGALFVLVVILVLVFALTR